MAEEKVVDEMLGDVPALTPEQWYLVRATAYVRRTAAGRREIKSFKADAVEVSGPDELPDETPGEPEAEPRGG